MCWRTSDEYTKSNDSVSNCSQVGRSVDDEAAVRAILVQLPGELHHSLRDVEPDALAKALGERAAEPANAAAEVESALAAHRLAEIVRDFQHLGDLRLAGIEELGELPTAAAALGARQNRPERVDARELLPFLLVPFETSARIATPNRRRGRRSPQGAS